MLTLCQAKWRSQNNGTPHRSLYFDREVIGKNLYNCHSPKSCEKIRMMMETGKSNSYEVILHGKHYFVHHTPWFKEPGGELSGLIELDIEIPESHPTFNRDKE